MTSNRRSRVARPARARDAHAARIRASGVVIAVLLAAAAPAAAQQQEPLTLERAIETALARNETALAAAERVRAADARVAQARAGFLPDVTAAGTYSRGTDDLGGISATEGRATGGPGGLSASATLTVPLFDPRNIPLHRRARLERDGAQLDAGDAREVLAFDVAASFFATLNAEQVLSAAERRLQLARATHTDARDRAAAGLVSSNDVTRAELELWSAERDLTRARSGLEVARVRLAYLLDAPLPLALAPPADVLAAASTARSEDDVVTPEELARRKDVRALQLRADALRAFADEARLRFLPSLALFGQLRATADEALREDRNEALFGATLSWNLWDGGQRAAERRERLALASIADLDRNAAARGTSRDVAEALSTLRAGQAATQQAESAAAAAKRNSDESTILYRQGLATALAVADASTRLFEAEVDLARARFDLAQGFLALRRATGLDPLGREHP